MNTKMFSNEEATRVKNYFSSLGNIRLRSQFGGYSLLADNVMFAVMLEGELYLRATGNLEEYFKTCGMQNMVYTKRGIPVKLNYYWVNQLLWQDTENLLRLARMSLQDSQEEENNKRHKPLRLKDFPNIDLNLERLLLQAGIMDIETLRLKGAKSCYLRMREMRGSVGLKVLLSLAGAIAGCHYIVLPAIQRQELTEWFSSISHDYSV